MALYDWQLLVTIEDSARRTRQPFDEPKCQCEERVQGLGLFLQGRYEIPTGARRLMGVTPRRKHLGSFANTQLSGNLTNVSLYLLTVPSWFVQISLCSSLCVLSVLFSLSFLEKSLWGPEDHTNTQVSGCTANLLLKEKWILISLQVSLATTGCGQELAFI